MRDYGQMTDPNEYPRPPAPQPPPPPYYPPGMYVPVPVVTPPTNGVAVASMVLGIIGLFVWPLAPFALVMGHTSYVQLRKRGERGEGQAITGAILGWLVTAPWLVFFIAAAIGAVF